MSDQRVRKSVTGRRLLTIGRKSTCLCFLQGLLPEELLEQSLAMTSQEILSPHGLSHHQERGETDTKLLEELIDIAIEKALKLQAENGRQVDIADTQSCGEPSVGCAYPFSPLSSILQLQRNSTSSSRSRNWALSKDSEDRRHVAAKIYALLVQWRSDFSFECRARVAAAVPIIEEALYHEAKSKEEYANPLLLDLQLLQVLRHFEAGNGLFLMQGASPLYPVRLYRTPQLSPDSTVATPIRPNTLLPEAPIPANMDEPSTSFVRTDVPSKETVGSLLDSEMRSSRRAEANLALRDAIALDQKRVLEEGLHRHGGFASKRIARRVAIMISRKSREESNRLKQELRKAMVEANPEILATVLAMAKRKCAGKDAKELCARAEAVLAKIVEQQCASDVVQRKRSGKTLGEMLQFGSERSPDTEESAITSSSSILQAESSQSNDGGSRIVAICRSESAESELNSCTNVDDENMEVSEKPNLGESSDIEMQSLESSSSSSLCCEGPVVAETIVLSSVSRKLSDDEALQRPLQEQGGPSVCAGQKFVVHDNVSSPSPQILVVCKAIEASACSSVVSSQGSPPESNIIASSQINIVVSSQKLSDRETIHGIIEERQGEFFACTSVNSSANAAALTTHKNSFAIPFGTSLVAHNETQTNSGATGAQLGKGESQQALLAAASTGEAASSSPARDKTVRLPLSSFLAKREDYGINSMGAFANYEDPWETWEEPTEQLDPLCCVCMVGLKGAAFVPCGHTFCRKCSRGLWRGRGSCPLCNSYIREILDIY